MSDLKQSIRNVQTILNVFRSWDTAQKRCISEANLASALQSIGTSAAEAGNLVGKAAKDANGNIDYEDFVFKLFSSDDDQGQNGLLEAASQQNAYVQPQGFVSSSNHSERILYTRGSTLLGLKMDQECPPCPPGQVQMGGLGQGMMMPQGANPWFCCPPMMGPGMGPGMMPGMMGGGYPMMPQKPPKMCLPDMPTDVNPALFDAHAHLFDFFQHSEGIGTLVEAMNENGVSHAAICGTGLKKDWSEYEQRRAPDPFNDTDSLYYFSLTDTYVCKALRKLPPATQARFTPLMSGFNPTDKSSPEQIGSLLDDPDAEMTWYGLGKVYMRASEITNITPPPRSTPVNFAWGLIMCEADNRSMPVIMQHNSSSESTKPYKEAFEYIHELKQCLEAHRSVKVLWVDAGIFARIDVRDGAWGEYFDIVADMLKNFNNLFVSLSPEAFKATGVNNKLLTDLVQEYCHQFMVGSQTMGFFRANDAYKKDWDTIKAFLATLTPSARSKVSFENAKKFYKKLGGSGQKSFIAMEKQPNYLKLGSIEYLDFLHGDVEENMKKDVLPPKPKHISLKGMKDGKLTGQSDNEIKHVTIDTHLHMLDFLQKSSGTRRILEAMDGCGVEKAVVIGMPCCKKWSKDEPEKPLYYQDDNGECYFYSYADQMVADAWLALPTEKRKRIAPVMASFNPTDISAVEHVRRMWNKYPKLWRGLGEVMCRHDDLTTLLQDNETPVINHMALGPIYEFCIEVNIPIMVHHNADRTAERNRDHHYEYLWEVQQVLDMFPDLKLVWCHAGVSRRTFEEAHHEMMDQMMSAHPNLHTDISWVTWEEVICDRDGKVKQGWIDLFEKHPTKFMIGSDQVGQFIGPGGNNWLRPEIVKYWQLAEVLKPETAKALLYDNAQRVWFDGWEMPTAEMGGIFSQIPPTMKCETLYMNTGKFVWEKEERY
jgi:predicted TIM-barrel fold metal-dependent hydrolase